MVKIKNKFKIVLLLILVVIVCTACFTGCDDQKEHKDAFCISFNLLGGKWEENSNAKDVVLTDKNNRIVLPENPVKEGFVFVGWSLTNVETDRDVVLVSSENTYSYDRTLYALWESPSENLIYEPIDENTTKVVGVKKAEKGNDYLIIPSMHDNKKVKSVSSNLYSYIAYESPDYPDASKLHNVCIDTGIEIIEKNAFKNCTTLNSIVLPSTIKFIGEGAFSDSKRLKINKIYTKTNVMEIEDGAFLDSVAGIKGGPIYIGNNLYKYLAPEPLSIDYNDFSMRKDTVNICNDAFKNVRGLKTIRIAKNIHNLNVEMFEGCEELRNIIVDSDNEIYETVKVTNKEIEGLSNENKGSLVLDKRSKSVVIGIAKYVDFADGDIVSIDDNAFLLSKNILTDVVIPPNIKYIGKNAFADNKNLRNVKFADVEETKGHLLIDEGAFQGTNMPMVVFSNNVQQIMKNAFKDCPMFQVYIDKSVEIIQENALPELELHNAINMMIYTNCEKFANDQWNEMYKKANCITKVVELSEIPKNQQYKIEDYIAVKGEDYYYENI